MEDRYEPTFTSSESSDEDEAKNKNRKTKKISRHFTRQTREPNSEDEDEEVSKELVKSTNNFPSIVSNNSSSECTKKNSIINGGEDGDEIRPSSRKVSFAQGTKKSSRSSSIHEGLTGSSWQTYYGIFLTLTCALSLASLGLIVKYLKTYNAMNLAFYRFAGMIIPSIPMLGYSLWVKKKTLVQLIFPSTGPSKFKISVALFGRSFVGFVAVLLHFHAIQLLTVADAMTVGSLTPVFVTLVAHTCLGEKFGFFPIFAGILTIAGIGFIARPPVLTGADSFDVNILIGMSYALVKMVFTSFAIVFIRYLRQVDAGVVLFISGILSVLQNSTAAFAFGVFDLNVESDHLIYIIMLVIGSFIVQLSFVLALKYEGAGPFSILMCCDVLFAFILQFVFLGTIPDVFSLVGAIIIMSGVCLTLLRKWLQSLPQEDTTREKFWFVLK